MNKEKVVYTLEEVKILVDEARRRERERCAKIAEKSKGDLCTPEANVHDGCACFQAEVIARKILG